VSSCLPINIDDLLRNRGIESERVEFKAEWNPEAVGMQFLRTICAYANDLHNLNGGYIVLGVGEQEGRTDLPPIGLPKESLDVAQKWIREHCNQIDPTYQPVISPEKIGEKDILVIWAPGSENRPHRAPSGIKGKSPRFWVRIGSETVDAEVRGNLLTQLMAQTARVPWDERAAPGEARVEDLREAQVREYLNDVGSGLLAETEAREIYRRMQITRPVNGHDAPKNVALLFFADEPKKWFRGAEIELVQFADGAGGDVQEERVFSGPLPDQVRKCLRYMDNLSAHYVHKQEFETRVRGWVSYPQQALRETLVNAVYHRSYEADNPEPTKVYLYPERIEIISYPGPVRGIEREHLGENSSVPPVPARNRRIGEFLKELKLAEGRLSGMPKVFRAMKRNGSPLPRFDFDPDRTYFRATLPAHPEYAALSAIRDAAYLQALGQREDAARRVESAWEKNKESAALASEVIRYRIEDGQIELAEETLSNFETSGPAPGRSQVANALIEALLESGYSSRARNFLQAMRPASTERDAIDTAILARRLNDSQLAHRYFERAGDEVFQDARALLEFAQAKLILASTAYRRRDSETNRRLLAEARTLLERAVQMDASSIRRGWAWRELGRALNWQGSPAAEIEDAYRRAIELAPHEERFKRELIDIEARIK